jgi:SAM-dependent methyltransferase
MSAQDEWWGTFFKGMTVDSWLSAMSDEQTQEEASFIEQALGVSPPARLLDVPCGGGRHCEALAARGYLMTGVDYSEDFLKVAGARPVQVAWERREMRDLPWRGEFDGAYCLGNSFGYLDDRGNAEFLAAVARTLRPGARFVLDTSYVVESLLPALQERTWYSTGDVLMLALRRYEPADGRLHVEYTFVRDGTVERQAMSARLHTYREVVRMMTDAGFAHIETYGSLKQDPFTMRSPRLLVVGEASGRA